MPSPSPNKHNPQAARQAQENNQILSIADALRSSGTMLAAMLAYDQVLNQLLPLLVDIIPFHYGCVLLVNGEHAFHASELTPAVNNPDAIYYFGEKDLLIQKHPSLYSMWTTGQPVIIPDLTVNPEWAGYMPQGMHSWIGTPVAAHERTLAFLSLFHNHIGFYEPHHITFLAAFSNLAGLALVSTQLRNQMQRLDITDPLTGLFNQRHLYDTGQGEFERARRYGSPLSLVRLQASNLKQINDTFGTSAGNRVMSHISKLLKEKLRSIDVPARSETDAFIVLLPQTSLMEARRTCERLKSEITRKEMLFQGKSIEIQTRFAAIEMDQSCPNFESLIWQFSQGISA